MGQTLAMGAHALSSNSSVFSALVSAPVAKSLRAFFTMLFPETCPGCGQLDTRLCDRCRGVFLRPPTSVNAAMSVDVNQVWTLSLYQGQARRVVLAMKHSRSYYYQQLPFFFGAVAGKALASYLSRALLVCPAPSTFRIGKTPISSTAGKLAAGIAAGLISQGLDVRLSGLLQLKPGTKKQAGRSFQERLRGRAGSMQLGTAKDLDFSGEVLLVDDVITTGATIREAVRVINEAQAQVKAVFSLSIAERNLKRG